MTLGKTLEALGIENYMERIFNSSSTGELFFLTDYAILLEIFEDDIKKDKNFFKDKFEAIVKMAEQKWKRPESIFQHIPKALGEMYPELIERMNSYTPKL